MVAYIFLLQYLALLLPFRYRMTFVLGPTVEQDTGTAETADITDIVLRIMVRVSILFYQY